MVIATWNVNSVRARLERLVRWLAARRPDVVCLQELKVTEAAFPFLELEAAGYHACVLGQKTYNGVAILARTPPAEVERGLPGDDQARLIAARVAGIRVLSAYVPNGGGMDSAAWAYKLDWLRRLKAQLAARYSPQEPLVLCGDLNVAIDARDVYDAAAWGGSVLFHPEARAALGDVMSWGLIDAFRIHRPEAGLYSWWDYRMLAFPKNLGLRIDHVLASEPVARRSTGASIDREQRKGKQPSDHAPVLLELDYLPSGS